MVLPDGAPPEHTGHWNGERIDPDCARCQASMCPECGKYAPMTRYGPTVHKCVKPDA